VAELPFERAAQGGNLKEKVVQVNMKDVRDTLLQNISDIKGTQEEETINNCP